MSELWRPVIGYEGSYEVSDLGNVRSLDRRDRLGRRIAGVLMKPTSKGTAPHLKVELSGGPDGRVTRLVHRIVLEAFDGPCPEGQECRHLDGDANNNRRTNLRWGTRSENNDDAVEHGTHYQVRKTHCPRGHLLARPNIVPAEARRGHRACLACSRAQSWAKNHHAPVMQELADSYYAEIGAAA